MAGYWLTHASDLNTLLLSTLKRDGWTVIIVRTIELQYSYVCRFMKCYSFYWLMLYNVWCLSIDYFYNVYKQLFKATIYHVYVSFS